MNDHIQSADSSASQLSAASSKNRNNSGSDLIDLFRLPKHALLTPNQCADALLTSPYTLANWRRERRTDLKFLKVGRLVRYRVSDVIAFIDRDSGGAA